MADGPGDGVLYPLFQEAQAEHQLQPTARQGVQVLPGRSTATLPHHLCRASHHVTKVSLDPVDMVTSEVPSFVSIGVSSPL